MIGRRLDSVSGTELDPACDVIFITLVVAPSGLLWPNVINSFIRNCSEPVRTSPIIDDRYFYVLRSVLSVSEFYSGLRLRSFKLLAVLAELANLKNEVK